MVKVPKDHPRYESLLLRDKVVEALHSGVLAEAGLTAHGRGEAFDYLLGEKTLDFAIEQERVAVDALLTAKNPVISVNGNVATLVPNEIVTLAKAVDAKLEVNLFYHTAERELTIKRVLEKAGADRVYGLGEEASGTVPGISSERRHVDPEGILTADVVLVPLEDGDRTMALRKMGDKRIIAIDLNPLSRTALWAHITIVNNVVRAIPEMIQLVAEEKLHSREELISRIEGFDNTESIRKVLRFISSRFNELGESPPIPEEILIE